MDKKGWQIRKIVNVKGDAVTLDYGITFNSPCFEGAEPGQIWAVNHDMDSGFAFGQITEAILLDGDNPVPNAMSVIKKAMIGDCPSEGGSYAHSWHCNMAMMCYDSMKDYNFVSGKQLTHSESHLISNDAASRFMKLCFDVETSN